MGSIYAPFRHHLVHVKCRHLFLVHTAVTQYLLFNILVHTTVAPYVLLNLLVQATIVSAIGTHYCRHFLAHTTVAHLSAHIYNCRTLLLLHLLVHTMCCRHPVTAHYSCASLGTHTTAAHYCCTYWCALLSYLLIHTTVVRIETPCYCRAPLGTPVDRDPASTLV